LARSHDEMLAIVEPWLDVVFEGVTTK